MPDGAKNFTYDGTNGPISTTTVTRDELITAMEHMNYAEGYNIRAIDELGASGMIGVDSLGAAWARSIAAENGLTVSNATGASGNPTIGIGTPSTVRQTIMDTEANTLTASPAVSIIAVSNTYTLPQPAASVISTKYVINTSGGNVTVTSSYWGDAGITTSVIIPTKQMAIFVSDVSQLWYVQVSGNLTIS